MYPGRPLGSTLWNWVGLTVLFSWDVRNGFAYVLTFFSLTISDGLGGVYAGLELGI